MQVSSLRRALRGSHFFKTATSVNWFRSARRATRPHRETLTGFWPPALHGPQRCLGDRLDGTLPSRRKQLAHAAKFSLHRLTREIVVEQRAQRRGDMRRGEIVLDQLRDSALAGHQVHHSHMRHGYHPPRDSIGELRDAIDNEKRSADERSLNRGRAARDHAGPGVVQGSACVADERDPQGGLVEAGRRCRLARDLVRGPRRRVCRAVQ